MTRAPRGDPPMRGPRGAQHSHRRRNRPPGGSTALLHIEHLDNAADGGAESATRAGVAKARPESDVAVDKDGEGQLRTGLSDPSQCGSTPLAGLSTDLQPSSLPAVVQCGRTGAATAIGGKAAARIGDPARPVLHSAEPSIG